MEKGDTVIFNGQTYTCTGTSEDGTEGEKLASARFARTLLERMGIPPMSPALLEVEPYSDAEWAALGDN